MGSSRKGRRRCVRVGRIRNTLEALETKSLRGNCSTGQQIFSPSSSGPLSYPQRRMTYPVVGPLNIILSSCAPTSSLLAKFIDRRDKKILRIFPTILLLLLGNLCRGRGRLERDGNGRVLGYLLYLSDRNLLPFLNGMELPLKGLFKDKKRRNTNLKPNLYKFNQ